MATNIRVYHNPRCSKSRAALAYLEDKNIEYDTIMYLNDIPTKVELKEVLNKLNISAEQLIRKGEAVYKEQYKGKVLTEGQWIDAMIKEPKLIERPIVVKGEKAVIARPTEAIEEIL